VQEVEGSSDSGWLGVVLGVGCAGQRWDRMAVVMCVNISCKVLIHAMCGCALLGGEWGRILMHVGGASDGSRLVVEYQKRYKMHT
jgi:hypothetical protein